MQLAVASANDLWVLGLWDRAANNRAGAYDTTSAITGAIYTPDTIFDEHGTPNTPPLTTLTFVYVAGAVTITNSGGGVAFSSGGGNYLATLLASVALVAGTQYTVKVVAVPLAGTDYQHVEAQTIVAQYASA